MFTQLQPDFQRGRILKTEMLNRLRDFPQYFTDIYFQQLSDGVVMGADVQVHDDILRIKRGIVKHAGRLYLLEEDMEVPYKATGHETVLKIRFTPQSDRPDFIEYGSTVVLDDDLNLSTNELELARFKLKEGAKLRSQYQSFADMTTEYNTLNIIHVSYAGNGNGTIHPAIIRYFASELLSKESANPYDIAFGMLCLNGTTVEREVLLHYVSHRLGIGYQDYANVQIHKYLDRILHQAGGSRSKFDDRHQGPRRMIVD